MNRVHAFDWLRGIALLVMIQTHALVLLKPEHQADVLFHALIRIDGLVAPSFIFCAGFALALVQCRLRQPRKSLKRIGEVLLVASTVNVIWFPIIWGLKPQYLLRLDILQCIGLSLLLALPLLVALASRPLLLRWVCLMTALVIFIVAPLFETVPGILGLFVNPQLGFLDAETGSVFPLLPWAGYVFLGASTGATIAGMKAEKDLWLWLGLLGGIGAILWWHQNALNLAYPPHTFWVTNPANAAQRWVVVVGLIAALRLAEIKYKIISQAKAATILTAFSTASLSAYVFHEMLLFQRYVGVFRFARGRCDWPMYFVLLGALIAATWVCVQAWSTIERRARAREEA